MIAAILPADRGAGIRDWHHSGHLAAVAARFLARATKVERGYYLHPDLYGAPPEKQIEWARHPELKRMKERQPKLSATAKIDPRIKR